MCWLDVHTSWRIDAVPKAIRWFGHRERESRCFIHFLRWQQKDTSVLEPNSDWTQQKRALASVFLCPEDAFDWWWECFFFLNGGGIKGWATIDKEIGTTGATMKVPICLCDFWPCMKYVYLCRIIDVDRCIYIYSSGSLPTFAKPFTCIYPYSS